MLKKVLIKYYFKKEKSYFAEYNCRKSIYYLDKILALDKDNVDALLFKGIDYAYLSDKENSMCCFDEAFKIDPGNLKICFKKAIALYHLNEFSLSIELFEKLLEYFPDFVPILNYIGQCYINLDDYDCALRYFNEALRYDEKNIEILVNIAGCYHDLGRYDEALAYLNKSLTFDSKNSLIFAQFSNVYMHTGDYKSANRYIDLALEQQPEDLALQISKNLILAYLGKNTESVEGFQKIKEGYFDDNGIIQLWYLYFGKALNAMGNSDEALKIFDEYLEKYSFLNEEIENEKDKIMKLNMVE